MAKRVLTIDDSSTVRKLVEIALRDTGWDVVQAPTGREGLARARDTRPSAILLDFILPDLPTAEVCEGLLASAETQGIPVLIMSAKDPGSLAGLRRFRNVVEVIEKPFNAIDLRRRLDTLEEARSEAALAAGSEVAAPAPSDAVPNATMPPMVSAAYSVPTLAVHEGGGLQLAGQFGPLGVLDVLSLVGAAAATGCLVIEGGASGGEVRVWARRGEVLMATAVEQDQAVVAKISAAHVVERIRRNQERGKPAKITIAEAGLAPAEQLPLELVADSANVLRAVTANRRGRFSWTNIELPDYVEAFGRHVSLTMLALEMARSTGAAAPSRQLLDAVYRRAPAFSQRMSGVRLLADEQRVLTLVDGRTPAHEFSARSRLPVQQVAAALERLVTSGLVVGDHPSLLGDASRRAVICDADEAGFIQPLRARLEAMTPPVELQVVGTGLALEALLNRQSPGLVIVAASELTPRILAAARDARVPTVALLPGPDEAAAEKLIRDGAYAVLSKPVHVNELIRLLPTS